MLPVSSCAVYIGEMPGPICTQEEEYAALGHVFITFYVPSEMTSNLIYALCGF